MKKRFFSFLLAIVMLFSVTQVVFAVETIQIYTVVFDNTTPHAGDIITATIYLDQAPTDYYQVMATLKYNKDILTYKSYTCSWENMTCTVTEKNSGDLRSRVAFRIDSNRGRDTDILNKIQTRQTGPFATVTFKVNESCEFGQAINYQLTGTFHYVNVTAAINNGFVTQSLVVTEEGGRIITLPKIETGYTVSMGADQQLTAGQHVRIPVTVASEKKITGFNVYDMTFTYDPEILILNTKSDDASGMTLEDTKGTIHVRRYGDPMDLGEALALDFTAKETASSTVKLTSARVDLETNSINYDIPEATITDADTVVDANNFTVTLPDEFTSDVETRLVPKGSSFTFKPVDSYYKHTFTVKMGDSSTEDLTFGADDTYTIENIDGDVAITYTGKTPKQYDVEYSLWSLSDYTVDQLEEDVTKGPDKATYLEDYSLVITPGTRVIYSVAYLLTYANGRQSNDVIVLPTVNDDGTLTYTIQGKNIVGKLTWKVVTLSLQSGYSRVLFTGNGAEDGAPENDTVVLEKMPYFFTLKERENCTYTVTAYYQSLYSRREMCTVSSLGNGRYAVEAQRLDPDSWTLVVNVEKVSHSAEEVTVSPYLELNDKTLMLVAVKGNPESGAAFVYDGNTMYKIQNHGSYGMNMQAWLVLVDKGQTLTQEEAASKVELSAADNVVTIDTSGDVNMTGTVDVNDVQLIYDMYNGVYPDLSQATVEKFLRADVNGSKNLDHADAVTVTSKFKFSTPIIYG